MNLSTLNPNELVGPSGRNVQSAYFDGTGDYLTVPYTSASFDWWTSDFTIEAWVYAGAWTNWSVFDSSRLVGNMDPTGGTNGWSFGPDTTGKLRFYYYTGTGRTVISSATLINSQWNHIAMTKTASGITLFINGAAETTTAIVGTPQAYTAQPLTIGSWYSTSIIGYVSNLRIIKGTALYTGNFTPPTAPLTPIANTSFLLGFSEYQFIDQSPNNFTITRNGDTTQSTFGPYGGNWSNYFDGTGDYLAIPVTSIFDYGTGNFTIELWFYAQVVSSSEIAIYRQHNSVGPFKAVDIRISSSKIVGVVVANATNIITGTTTLSTNTWYHVAFVRSGNVFTLYLNGASEGTATDSGALDLPTTVRVAANQVNALFFTGYISNVRVVKGTAVYTSNFTPPTAPLSSIPNTSLLTCQSNRFLDASPNNSAITRNGDVSVQPYVPFPANWSNFFDGNGDNLKVTSSLLQLGTSDFTLEFWAYFSSFGSSDIDFFRHDTGSQAVGIGVYNFGADLRVIYFPTGATVANFGAKTQIGLNQWTHVAITRSGNNFRCFLNGGISSTGVQVSSQNLTLTTTNTFRIMEGSGVVYISNYRLIIGTALYTSNFTPPTTPLTAIPNTSLLTCQSSSFTDFSPNNFTVTANGDVSARFYGPFAGPVPEPVVDVYTTTGVANTWIKRPGAKAVQMIAIGAGGGGGGGGGSATGNFRSGGGGGGGGANGQIIYTADQLPSTLFIRVGASGTGGASNGAGGAGGNSTIAAADPIISSTSVYCMGGGGGGGKGGGLLTQGNGGGGGGTAGAGTTGTGSSAVSGGLPAISVGDAICGGGGGGAYSNSAAPGRAEWGGAGGGSSRQEGDFWFAGASSLYGGGGGGCGATLDTGGGVRNGTGGGASGLYSSNSMNVASVSPPGGAAATSAANGGAGANAAALYAAGSGGGGGYGNNAGTGFTGGAGGFPGGGGGGGGASSSTGGTGGVGGAGRVVLVTFF